MNAVDPQSVTWVHVEKPVFDLWGVLSSSLTFAGSCILTAAVLGALLGWLRIRRQREPAGDGVLLPGLRQTTLPTSPT